MNTTELQEKVTEVIGILNVASEEAGDIERKRISLQTSINANTQRESSLYRKEVEQKQKEDDLDAQQKFIEEQIKNSQTILNKITEEKKDLKDLKIQKSEIETERLQLEADKKSFETLKQEKEDFLKKRAEFEEERQLFSKEKLAIQEAQKLMATREVNIKTREDKLDKIERMTEV